MHRWPVVPLFCFVISGCTEQAPLAPAPEAAAPAEAVVTEPPEGQTEPVLESAASPAIVQETPATAPAAAGDLKLETLDWEQTQAIVKAHSGKVVVFDLWATYCPPCLKELPGLVALQAQYPDQVVCVSVCLDYEGDPENPPSKIEPDIRKVLEKINAHHVRNILLSTSADDLFNVIEHKSMPVLYVFDQTGQRVAAFPDRKDPVEPTYAKDIVPLVEKLLAAPNP